MGCGLECVSLGHRALLRTPVRVNRRESDRMSPEGPGSRKARVAVLETEDAEGQGQKAETPLRKAGRRPEGRTKMEKDRRDDLIDTKRMKDGNDAERSRGERGEQGLTQKEQRGTRAAAIETKH
jgi:hypothetical protein